MRCPLMPTRATVIKRRQEQMREYMEIFEPYTDNGDVKIMQ